MCMIQACPVQKLSLRLPCKLNPIMENQSEKSGVFLPQSSRGAAGELYLCLLRIRVRRCLTFHSKLEIFIQLNE